MNSSSFSDNMKSIYLYDLPTNIATLAKIREVLKDLADYDL